MNLFITNMTLRLAIVLSLLSVAQARDLVGPTFNPPFGADTASRQDAKLYVQEFKDGRDSNRLTKSASLVVGNKRVGVREFDYKTMHGSGDQVISIFVNDRPVSKLAFYGTIESQEKGPLPLTHNYKSEDVTLNLDPDARSIQWIRPYQISESLVSQFTYKLVDLGQSKIELSWDLGLSDDLLKSIESEGYTYENLHLFLFTSDIHRQESLMINNEPVTLLDEAELKANEREKLSVWNGDFSRFDFCLDKPTQGFSVSSEAPVASRATEVFQWQRIEFGVQMFLGQQGKLVIDLGDTIVTDTQEAPPVEGHDFWAEDALHVPASPVRNFFPNPSFEQGLRYWTWWHGGAFYDPADVTRHAIDNTTARFGNQSLVINPTQQRSMSLMSFSLPGIEGETYSVSYYAKAEQPDARLVFAPFSTKRGGKYTRSHVEGTELKVLTGEWQRFSSSFVSDGGPVAFVLRSNNAGGKIWVDGIQIEKGEKETEFISPPLEGRLTTSHPDNNVEFGQVLDAKFEVCGDDAASGQVELTLIDFFDQTLWQESFAASVGQSISLPFDSLNLSTGAFIVRARFTHGTSKPYYDYFRFAYIDSLEGKHATKNLYGALLSARVDRTDDLLKLMERLGHGGSTSYGSGKWDPMNYTLREKYNITDFTHTLMEGVWIENGQDRYADQDYLYLMSLNPRIWRRPSMNIPIKEYYTEEDVKRVEEIAYRCAKLVPEARVWAFGTEEEILLPPIKKRKDYKEVVKLLIPFYKGIKRANPDAIVLPSGGTSGYSRVRGYDAIEGYLSATQGIVKWDAVAVHPYGACDGTLGQQDLDETIQMLSDSMAKFGYGEETPIYFNEGGGQGKIARWGEGPDYTYSGGPPSYDQGLREFMHACYLARQYIICLKYWPRLEHFNCWMEFHNQVLGHDLTPTTGLLGINTLGHLLGNPTFVSDIRPAPGMRGYSFADKNGKGVAAIWCTSSDVDRGFLRGPVLSVKFEEMPEVIDLMGKRHPAQPDEDGYVQMELGPAPVFLRGDDPQQLTAALKSATVLGSGPSVQVAFKPSLDGQIQANILNLTGAPANGSIVVDDADMTFKLSGNEATTAAVGDAPEKSQGKMLSWNKTYQIKQPQSKPFTQTWNMDYFYVPHVEGEIDWDTIPAIQMTNMYRPTVKMKKTPGGHSGDLEATFKVAWDSSNLYLRVEATDDRFIVDNPEFWASEQYQKTHLYLLDGCLEVYFDCQANGRSGDGSYDLDDYRYDFCVGNAQGLSGPGLVNRLREVFQEYAGGVEFPSKQEVARSVPCEFTRISDTKYAYTIRFAQRYLEPMRLEKGTVAGFGLYLHDRMDDGTLGHKGMSLATEEGAHCDGKSNLWPLMILSD